MTVSKPEIPHLDVLLHADCNGQEVTCEMSHFSPEDSAASDQDLFMVSLNVEDEGFSTSLILQTLKVEQEPAARHSKLGLPLSPAGTVHSEGKT